VPLLFRGRLGELVVVCTDERQLQPQQEFVERVVVRMSGGLRFGARSGLEQDPACILEVLFVKGVFALRHAPLLKYPGFWSRRCIDRSRYTGESEFLRKPRASWAGSPRRPWAQLCKIMEEADIRRNGLTRRDVAILRLQRKIVASERLCN
jgi:hypothetical protein